MIRIGFSFLAAALLFVVLGKTGLFVSLFVSVTLHELAHILAARRFGGRVEGISFTALGETALIRGMALMPAYRRVMVLLAGPMANALTALLVSAVCALFSTVLPAAVTDGLKQISLYNMVLCIGNLMPVLPLDGGRLAQILIGNRAGVLRANRMLVRLSRAAGLLLIIPGLVQAALFPYNISLICMGFYLWRSNAQAGLMLTCEFFQMLNEKEKRFALNDFIPVKTLAVGADCPLQRMVERLAWDSYTYFVLDGKPYNRMTEAALTRHIMQYGLGGTAGEAYARL